MENISKEGQTLPVGGNSISWAVKSYTEIYFNITDLVSSCAQSLKVVGKMAYEAFWMALHDSYLDWLLNW